MEVVDNLHLHLPLFTSPGVQLMNQVTRSRWPRRWWTTRTWTSPAGLQHPACCELLWLSGQEPQQFMNNSLPLIKDSAQHLRSDPWRQKFPPYWIPENPSPLFSGYAQSRGATFYSLAFSHKEHRYLERLRPQSALQQPRFKRRKGNGSQRSSTWGLQLFQLGRFRVEQ